MTKLTPEEREIIVLLEARTRETAEGLAAREHQSPYTKEMLDNFTAQNKAYKIALETK